MKFLPNNFLIKHRTSNCLLPIIIFCKTYKATNPAAITTATITIFMQVVVFVNTTETSGHIRLDTEITKAPVTWAKTLNGISKNPLIAQQPPKMPTKKPWQPPYSSTGIALKASSTLNHLHVSQTTTATTITTSMKQPRATSSAKISASSLAKGDCKFPTDAWGDIDPNVFFICDKQTKQPLQLRCPEGKGFFFGLGFSGCIPFEQWPACISSRHREQVPLCDSEHMQQLWEFKNPNKFYACLKETVKPTILNCETGKGFVHVTVTTSVAGGGGGVGATATSEIVGCANWEKWRNYMHCNDYY